ncbi:acyl-CoA dehydrogenase family protein [Kocuria carniphila]|uniref:acyl-CoA dehydrogenase family protein n=1 Tax=Kocuria carniphila TaxID=262208 RepID=UPI001875FBA1|nr:acyl-CoA dehydrogenase family protein [Kocuria carniphila]
MFDQSTLPIPQTPRPDQREVQEFVRHGLAEATTLTRELPLPGQGSTRELWARMSDLARQDLALARIVEPHLDATAIIDQAGRRDLLTDSDTWAVWAAEGPGTPQTATPSRDGWTLSGTKPWCSLADFVSRAVVTAHVADESGELTGHRRAFVISTDHAGFLPEHNDTWVAQGLADVPTTAVDFREVPAEPLGEDEWYLTRPGFAWGGMGVAAIWLGGAQSVADLLWQRSRQPRKPLDDVALAHLGRVDLALTAASAVLDRAACAVDNGDATGEKGALWALRVRRTVADAAETVLREVSRATGPGPLTGDAAHIRRVMSLQVYIRQDHAERDNKALGELLLAAAPAGEEGTPW